MRRMEAAKQPCRDQLPAFESATMVTLQAYVAFPNATHRVVVPLPDATAATAADLVTALAFPTDTAYLATEAGRILAAGTLLAPLAHDANVFVQVLGRLCGGKGGFGSMLRAQGGRMSSKKTINYDSCRDLSGRRLKTVKDAKLMTEALEKIAEKEAEREARIAKKIEQGLNPPTTRKRRFDDATYDREHKQLVGSIRDAALQVFKNPKRQRTASESDESDTEEQTSASSSSSSSSSPMASASASSSNQQANRASALSYWDEALSSGSESEGEEDKVNSVAEASSSGVAKESIAA
ncbi:hypothetical protein AMAG_10119 [Allomyces macrogynus ATCC 38327]|uniref:SDE2-like domain-containing protein n=1 Tax=Allomyces macrogynus (strain ATCC 38327) TaxID=578462 RepID=A0A0L0SQJ7_ALLM3|nr:hypothetical protein AMAG_10119 [Allomyces macrogynus ATCC 38327]|eukprot:KNE64777.1 hypothetical protein AMAG_10119 [Allomyces macrogynus ATCC 38327]